MDRKTSKTIMPPIAAAFLRKPLRCHSMVAEVSLFLLTLLSLPLQAQERNDSIGIASEIEIGEVTVQGNRVVNTDNGRRIYPSRNQLEASANGYSLLKSLALPGIQVDEVTHEIKSPDILGTVQVRINDVVATVHDILALDMQTLQSVDFIQEPGLRYGKDVAYVINLNVVRPTSGYAVGGEIIQQLTCLSGSESLFARFNRGKSEFSLDCDLGWRDIRGTHTDRTTCYTLDDGAQYTAATRDIANPNRTTGGSLRLRYSLSDSGKYQFDVSLSEALSYSPASRRVMEMTTPVGITPVTSAARDRESSPRLDLYMNIHLPRRQSITASATAAYTESRYEYRRNALGDYAYSVRGSMRSVSGEVLYENRLKPFTFSAGLQYSHDRIGNDYSGDVESSPVLRQSEAYAYALLNGKFGSLGWKAGLGVSQRRYDQGDASFRYTLPRPAVMLNYKFSPAFSLRYNYELSIHAPRIMFLSDVTTTDEVVPLPAGVIKEMSVGNPLLSPDNRNEHTLTFSFTGRKVESVLSAMYLFYRKNTIMQAIDRHTLNDGTTLFLFSRRNQGAISMMDIYDHTTMHLLGGKLDAVVYGAVAHYRNRGDDYMHTYTSLMYSVQVNAYLGRLSLSAIAGNGWSFMEGETKVKDGASTCFSASYRLSSAVRLALVWQNLFRKDIPVHEMELLNRNISKNVCMYSSDTGNKVTLQLNINLSKGRKFTNTERRLKSRSVETGVVKHGQDNGRL
ncbi:MAG: outer membrane beta-barrel family protein [Bacteroidales bacterium]|nr:outer membrane beta-barrel family protein [Bacteroidales bacterium]MCM1147199.1 outer membrane beta-barrel family protein [Bacteroidales bacterium]MCM1205425.1 outer membrane beta-barrel family protein [Bacillota bacterium]MCM1509770.1 outer membrane beta-barrel family protein [Clostridium sp.]